MDKVISIRLEWTYKPIIYLEEFISISSQEIQLSITDGRAEAIVDPEEFESQPNIKDELTNFVKSRLDAVQLLTHKEYTLSKPNRTDFKEDGTQEVYIAIEKMVQRQEIGMVDLVQKDKEGNILTDSKKEKQDRIHWFAEAVSKFRSLDKTLDQLLMSYQRAITDPDNELLYLYEIRDALQTKFGNKKNSKKQLNII